MMLKSTVIILSFIFIYCTARSQADYKPVAPLRFTLQGFSIILNVDTNLHPEAKEALRMLNEKLSEFPTIIKPQQLSLLQKIPVWIEWNVENVAMCYHISRQWLVDHGYSPEKAKCVAINNITNFIGWQKLNQPYMVLHEFAHGYHDMFLGADYKPILDAYNNAVASKKYENVAYNLGGTKTAYALKNADEYFAELTEAYLGINDFYPFNKKQLQEFDPVGYELMQKVWD